MSRGSPGPFQASPPGGPQPGRRRPGAPGRDPRSPATSPPSPSPADWLGGHLLARRVVMLSGEMDSSTVGHVIAQLMTLDAEGDDGIELYIDSSGDDVGAALALMDVIDMLGVDVTGTAMGRAEGTAVGALAVCTVRRMAPNARVMLREPRFDVLATARDLEAWSSHARAQLEAFITRLAVATGKAAASVGADLERGLFLDAAAAVAYGLADSVATQLRVVAGSSDS